MIRRIACALACVFLASSTVNADSVVCLKPDGTPEPCESRKATGQQPNPPKSYFEYYEPGAAPPYHEVTEADMRAIATRPRWRSLPPLEYDHPFAGRLLVMLGGGQFSMRGLCKREWPISLYGCAVSKYHPWARVLDPDGKADCIVVHATEAFIEATGWTFNLLLATVTAGPQTIGAHDKDWSKQQHLEA